MLLLKNSLSLKVDNIFKKKKKKKRRKKMESNLQIY